MSEDIHPLVKLLCEDRRYKLDAYQFVRAGLSYAQDVLELGGNSEEFSEPELAAEDEDGDDLDLTSEETADARPLRHVTGQDLCHGLKLFAQEQFGLMAKLVLESWGVHSTSDFGEIVYNLIKIGEMTKSPHDRREDFDDVFDFDQALVKEFAISKPA